VKGEKGGGGREKGEKGGRREGGGRRPTRDVDHIFELGKLDSVAGANKF
jgi:hypothetical protein